MSREESFAIDQAQTSRKSRVHVTHGRTPEIKVTQFDVIPSVNKPFTGTEAAFLKPSMTSLSICHFANLQNSFKRCHVNSGGEDLEKEVKEV